jgi:hypothetical protein
MQSGDAVEPINQGSLTAASDNIQRGFPVAMSHPLLPA